MAERRDLGGGEIAGTEPTPCTQSKMVHMTKATWKSLCLPLSLILMGCAELGLQIPTTVPSNSSSGALDRATVVAGLKEALEIGTQRAINRTGTLDGFLANELIRVALPQELDTMARTLRKIGLSRQVDEMEIGMNRAAEQAVGEARDVLWQEIRRLTIADAWGILRGGPTAATDYFHERTSDEIRSRFQPIVVDKMNEVGLSRLYGDLAGRYNELPFVSKPAIDLNDYVTEQALSGLFTVLGEEEAHIREDPVARATDLLRRVFSNRGV